MSQDQIDRPPALTAALRRAYRAALYRFDTPGGELRLAIDAASAPLQQLLRDCGHGEAAALTAFNPGSTVLDAAVNQCAQQQLERELLALGLVCFHGTHVDPAGQWPDEASVLAVGLPCATARALAARFGQLAFLWMDATGTPRLVETARQQDAADC